MKTLKFIWKSRRRVVFFSSVLMILYGPIFAFKNPGGVLPPIGVTLIYAWSFLSALIALKIWVNARNLQKESAKDDLALLTDD